MSPEARTLQGYLNQVDNNTDNTICHICSKQKRDTTVKHYRIIFCILH